MENIKGKIYLASNKKVEFYIEEVLNFLINIGFFIQNNFGSEKNCGHHKLDVSF